MKSRHVAGARLNARATLQNLNIAIGQDFHTLSFAQVLGLVNEARRVRYQAPARANASLGRYFYDRLQRQAQ